MQRTYFKLTLIALALTGCGSQVTPFAATVPAAPTRHVGPGRVAEPSNRFSIVPPRGYASDGPSAEHFLRFLGPEEGGMTVNFNVTLHRDGHPDPQHAAATIRMVMGLLLKDYRQAEEGFLAIDGRDAYYCSGTFDWKGCRCRNLQYFMRGRDDRVYVITFASRESTFPAHRADFERSAATAQAD